MMAWNVKFLILHWINLSVVTLLPSKACAFSNEAYVDCAIIGGGPAGLATAIALCNSCPTSITSIGVFEQDSFQPKGASIIISGSGWRSLEALENAMPQELQSLQSRLKEDTSTPVTAVEIEPWLASQPNTRMGRYWHRISSWTGNILTKVILPLVVRGILRKPALAYTHQWHEVRMVLAEHASKLYETMSTPDQPSLLHPNSTLVSIEHLSSSSDKEPNFKLCFENWHTGDSQTVLARHLFACDGTKSSVRRLLPKEPKAEEILIPEHKSVWRGIAPDISTNGRATFFRGKPGGSSEGRSGLIFPAGKDKGSSWTVICDSEHLQEDRRSQSDQEARNRVLAAIATMGTSSDSYQRLKQAIDNSPHIIEHKLLVRDFDKPWNSAYESCVYVGDAAHPIRPTGEGTALAFEDANVLSHMIQTHGLGAAALRAYETARYQPVKDVSDKQRAQTASFYSDRKTDQEWRDGARERLQ